jgi:hypothetical protein
MIQVTLGTNTNRAKVLVDPNTTLRTVLEDNDINYASGNLHLDGSSLKPGDLDKTFAELGITANCYLLSIQKADNAK